METDSDPCGPRNQTGRLDPQLAAKIEEAFATVPYPGDDWICHGDTEVARLHGSEAASIAAVFRGRHWREMPLDALSGYSSALTFLTPEAYRFYLPAYLLAVLRLSPAQLEQVPRAGDLDQDLLYSLMPATDTPDLWDYRHRRLDPLTPDQKSAVQAFLHWMYRERWGGELVEDEKSLLAYWGYPGDTPFPSEGEAHEALPTVIDGARRTENGELENDGPNCQLINRLVANRLIHVDQREGGWPKLYHDPSDGAYWELDYPHTEMYGGGAPMLTRLSAEQVRSLYHLPALEQR
jgi:hypothetical protein